MSGLFKGSQINWACLTKEAYAIYMSVKKLAYYLEDANVTLSSDYLPLWKFLEQNTLNLKVNGWSIEISPYCIDFQYIKGIKNTLVDTMSRLVEIDPETELEAEPYGYEYGCYMFEDPPILQATSTGINEIVESLEVQDNKKDPYMEPDQKPLINKIEELIDQQKKDKFCSNIICQLKKG